MKILYIVVIGFKTIKIKVVQFYNYSNRVSLGYLNTSNYIYNNYLLYLIILTKGDFL